MARADAATLLSATLQGGAVLAPALVARAVGDMADALFEDYRKRCGAKP